MKTWKMRRNCSLTPKQLIHYYVLLIGCSLTVGLGFLIGGVWVVFIFTMIELCAVTLGFVIYSRHATDFEEIQIDGTELIVTKYIGCQYKSYTFNTRWARLSLSPRPLKSFRLSQSDQLVDVGQFLLHDELRTLISEIRRYLR